MTNFLVDQETLTMPGFEWVAGIFTIAALMLVIPPMLPGGRKSGIHRVLSMAALDILVLLPAVVLLVCHTRGEQAVAADKPVLVQAGVAVADLPSGPLRMPATGSGSATQPARNQAGLLPVKDMAGKLEQRLQCARDDAKGWLLLGRSYEYPGRSADAQNAFARARQLGETVLAAATEPVRIHGKVTLGPTLQARLGGIEALYVFARALNGPRMPLAALRKRASDLPVEFELKDSMAIAPKVKLSGFGEVVVGTRISVSGSPSASAGDLEGFSGVVHPTGPGPVTITIDQSVLANDASASRGGRG
jgi:hypothetical protein